MHEDTGVCRSLKEALVEFSSLWRFGPPIQTCQGFFAIFLFIITTYLAILQKFSPIRMEASPFKHLTRRGENKSEDYQENLGAPQCRFELGASKGGSITFWPGWYQGRRIRGGAGGACPPNVGWGALFAPPILRSWRAKFWGRSPQISAPEAPF